jgi:lipoic acid synthetase
MKTKSGIMLGMSEKKEEVLSVMQDLRSSGCDFLSIGQYLAPSQKHYPVQEYITPAQFIYYKERGEELGFTHIESAPYVRSSYCAGDYLSAC